MWTCSRCGEKVRDGFEVCWACGTSIDGVPDPNFFDESEERDAEHKAMSGPVSEELGEMVTVATFSFPYQAHAAKLKLEAEGISVYLADELTIQMDWLLSNAIGGVKVQVPSTQARRARRILTTLTSETSEEVDAQEEEGEQ
jgi:hypothetical protein